MKQYKKVHLLATQIEESIKADTTVYVKIEKRPGTVQDNCTVELTRGKGQITYRGSLWVQVTEMMIGISEYHDVHVRDDHDDPVEEFNMILQDQESFELFYSSSLWGFAYLGHDDKGRIHVRVSSDVDREYPEDEEGVVFNKE